MRPVESELGRRGRFSEFTLWPRIAGPLSFVRAETGGAAALLAATAAALVWASSPWPSSNDTLWSTMLAIRFGRYGISQDLRRWVKKA